MGKKNPLRFVRPLRLEQLEDRTLPASTITVVVGANGSGSLDGFLFDATPGVIATADGGNSPGTVSTGALTAVASGTDISVTAQNGISFNDLAGTLALQTGLGRSATFNSGSGALTVANAANTLATAGGSITYSAGGSLAAPNLNSNGGNVSLTAGTAGAGSLTVGAIQTAAAGNIVLQATNAAGGTVTQTGSAVGQKVTVIATGNIALDAVRGTTVSVTSNNGSVSSLAGNAIQSISGVSLSAATGIVVNILADNVQATNIVSGNVGITQLPSPAQALTTAGAGVRNQAAGGSVTVTNLGDMVTVAATAPVQANNGPITIAGQDLNVLGTIKSGAARTTLANSTAGRPIDLGTNTVGTVGLTQAELNEVTAGVLTVGSATAGTLNISAPITAPAAWITLALVGGGNMSESGPGSLTVPNLRVSEDAAEVVRLNNNNIGALGADLASQSQLRISDANALVIGVVDGDSGITGTGNVVSISADSLDVQQPINAGAIEVAPMTSGVQVSLGGVDSAGTLGLTDTELSRLTTGQLDFIGSSITISGAVNRHPGYGNLALATSGGVTQTAALSVANLLLNAGIVTLTNAGNDVDFLSGAVQLPDAAFTYRDANGFAVGSPIIGAGITDSGGTVSLTSGGAITGLDATATNVTATGLTATAATGIDLNTQVGVASANLTGNGPITLTEAATATINGLNAGTGTITLDGGTFALGSTNAILAASSLIVAGATLNLQAFNDAVAAVQLTSGSITGSGTLTSANTFDVRSGTVSARLGGSVGLTKITAGTVTLSGANGYSGTTSVLGGTLLVNGILALGSSVMVNGGTLGGTGMVGPVIVSSGAVSPGDSPGQLTALGNVSFASSASFVVQLNGITAGALYDQLKVNGTVNLGGAGLNISLGSGFTPTVGTPFVIIDNDGTDPVNGAFAGLAQGSTVTIGGVSFHIIYSGGTGNDVVLTAMAAAPALQSIAITPANPTLAKGLTQQFTATGTYSDNSTQNLTSLVTWASATPAVATINATGLAAAVAAGTSTISATLSGITGSTTLTVTAAALQSIAVTPANPSVARGQTQQFTATGTYSDNSTQNLTGLVTWASATPAAATINSAGLATGVAVGTSAISATLGGVSGSTTLTVTALALQSIAVSPANPSVAKGLFQQFIATGLYSDGSSQNVTSQVTWASATPAVATISGGGLATAVAGGTTSISATLGGVTGLTVLTVTAPALQSIAVTPANPSVPRGQSQQFTATGTYTDNSTQNLTNLVTWASGAPAVATINGTGLTTAIATGTTTISATLGGVSGSTVLTVTPTAPLAVQSVQIDNGTAQRSMVRSVTVTFSGLVTFAGPAVSAF
jgi:uncharacterized protein YjdB